MTTKPTATELYGVAKKAIDDLYGSEDYAVVYDLLEELSADINAKIWSILNS